MLSLWVCAAANVSPVDLRLYQISLNSFRAPLLSDAFRQAIGGHSKSLSPAIFRSSLLLPIRFESRYVEDLLFSHDNRFLPEDMVHCFNCQFLHCRVPDSNGGAIQTNEPLYTRNCYFLNCSAPSGGSIATTSFLGVSQSTFESSSSDANGVFLLHESSKFIVDETLIYKCHSTSYGISRRFGGDRTAIHDSNFSCLHVESGIGCFEFGQCSPKCERCLMTCISSRSKNEAMSIWQCNDFLVREFVFRNITAQSDDQSHGVVFWLDGSLLTGKIMDSVFIRCSSKHQKVIFMMAGSSVNVDNCVFDSKKDRFANDHGSLFLGKTIVFGASRGVPTWAGAIPGASLIPSRPEDDDSFVFVCGLLSISSVILFACSCSIGTGRKPMAFDSRYYHSTPE
jgi:hypothetical protein